MERSPVIKHQEIQDVQSFAETTQRVRYYQGRARAQSTRKAREDDWQDFTAWCLSNQVPSLPASPEVVAAYITDLADGKWMKKIILQLETENKKKEITVHHRRVAANGHKVATIQRRLANIGQCHKISGFQNPTEHPGVKEVLAGIVRDKGSAQDRKSPVLADDLRAFLQNLPSSILGTRDKAILLLGFAGAFRRSEIVGLNFEDVEFNSQGLVVFLRKSKTDQERKGRKVGVSFASHAETCPVKALREWLQLANITEGPIFRGITKHAEISKDRLTSQVVALIVKRTAEKAGLDPKRFSGHSLRAGLVTQAYMGGASQTTIMNQTGHTDPKTVTRYIREEELFRDNVMKYTGL